MPIRRQYLFFYPTRFHIFDQLANKAFKDEEFWVYSIYPPSYFRRGPYTCLQKRNKTLWLGLLLRALFSLACRVGVSSSIKRATRSLYVAGCALEFRFRTRGAPPAVVITSAGYLGRHVKSFQRAGHKVVSNHGSLYEPFVREEMLSTGTQDRAANWAHSGLMTRMDEEFAASDSILVCSPVARETFPEVWRDKVGVVPLGAPVVDSNTLVGHQNDKRKGVTFVHISNLSVGKNLAGVLNAFAEIREKEDHLIIGGPAPRDSALCRRLSRPEPGVSWIGRLDRQGVINAMSRADIFVHPSFADGWGMVITEALAVGLLIIASRNTGAASYYAEFSGKGQPPIQLVDPNDHLDIARAMAAMREKVLNEVEINPIQPMTWVDSGAILKAKLWPLTEM